MQIILAPTNLGLSPLRPGHIPGTWRAPQALMAQRLAQRLGASGVSALPQPVYSPLAQPGTRIRNGHAIRAFNLQLAAEVAGVQQRGDFPLVIGGDCSILLGALAGSRSAGPLSLVHIDGHSDFRHPGNYDPGQMLGAVAGMDLALATGRGEALLTEWPGVTGPLVPEQQIVQLGERESRDADFAWPDINQTAVKRLDIFAANQMGKAEIMQQIERTLAAEAQWRFWLHLDVDVLDREIMPAVDSPGSPGLDRLWLEYIGARLLQNPLCCGMTLSVFDPDLDTDGRYAALIVEMLEAMFAHAGQTPRRP
ncbi:Arginase [Serratia entomophila]|uniref:arginase family protein n=1 Tax=Serratia entomophila TaxID=42906 RepID=UPI001F1EDEB1|nr:arginase family protein [Serratia entomophila]UIW18447.1 arginase family protein [Serratia entomophila]CAI0988788.1 Arginase [Serratia entomophila]CAI0997447.1 Arginase [Serratia entomophila]CAI1002258.1 Arginase [Serratia entomophila]CAI1020287.1 Arginase [Serratia entomophila]